MRMKCSMLILAQALCSELEPAHIPMWAPALEIMITYARCSDDEDNVRTYVRTYTYACMRAHMFVHVCL